MAIEWHDFDEPDGSAWWEGWDGEQTYFIDLGKRKPVTWALRRGDADVLKMTYLEALKERCEKAEAVCKAIRASGGTLDYLRGYGWPTTAAALEAFAALPPLPPEPKVERRCDTCAHETASINMEEPCVRCFRADFSDRWEPASQRPATPKCADCGKPIEWEGRCVPCARAEIARQKEAARVARLRERIKPGVCVQHKDGRQGVVISLPPEGPYLWTPSMRQQWQWSDIAGPLVLEEGE